MTDEKDQTKVKLIDAMVADMDLHMSSPSRIAILYSRNRKGAQRTLFRWNRSSERPYLPALIARPLTLQEALALVDDNWERRVVHAGLTWKRP